MTDHQMEYIPFTYLIGWSALEKYYYGVSYANGRKIANPKILWITYFTSSKLVTKFRNKHGEPDIITVRKTFKSADHALNWEHRVLMRIDARNNPKMINMNNGDKKFRGDRYGINNPMFGKTQTFETRQKIGKANTGRTVSIETRKILSETGKGRVHSEDTKSKMSAWQKGKKLSSKQIEQLRLARIDKPFDVLYGKEHSLEIKRRMSNSHKGLIDGVNNPMFGKQHSSESKKRMSAAGKGSTKLWMHNMVGAITIDGNIIKVTKSEFDSNPDLVGLNNKIGRKRIKMKQYAQTLNDLVTEIHTVDNVKWWLDLNTMEPITITRTLILEKLMLVVTEIAEAAEGVRKDLPDDKLPHRSMVECELADAVIRIMDLAGALNLDLGGALMEKRAFNATRIDHSIEHRLGPNGKKV